MVVDICVAGILSNSSLELSESIVDITYGKKFCSKYHRFSTSINAKKSFFSLQRGKKLTKFHVDTSQLDSTLHQRLVNHQALLKVLLRAHLVAHQELERSSQVQSKGRSRRPGLGQALVKRLVHQGEGVGVVVRVQSVVRQFQGLIARRRGFWQGGEGDF